MTTQTDAKARIEMLKGLRETHAGTFSRTQDLLKAQKQLQQEITKALKEQARTVPELAAATGILSRDLLWFLMAMKKYGLVLEAGMQDDYPKYKLAEEK